MRIKDTSLSSGNNDVFTPVSGTGGAANTRLVANEVAFPQQYYTNSSSTLAASATGTVVYTSPDISMYDCFMLEIAAIGGTTPKINGFYTLDGTNLSATPLAWIDLNSGALITGTTGLTAIGIYMLASPVGGGAKAKGLKLTITGGASDLTCTTRFAHGVV